MTDDIDTRVNEGSRVLTKKQYLGMLDSLLSHFARTVPMLERNSDKLEGWAERERQFTVYRMNKELRMVHEEVKSIRGSKP